MHNSSEMFCHVPAEDKSSLQVLLIERLSLPNYEHSLLNLITQSYDDLWLDFKANPRVSFNRS